MPGRLFKRPLSSPKWKQLLRAQSRIPTRVEVCVCCETNQKCSVCVPMEGSEAASYSLLTPPHTHRRCTLLLSHNHWRGFEEQGGVLYERLISGSTHPNKSWNKLTVLQYKKPILLQSGRLTEIRDFNSDTLFSLVDDFQTHEIAWKRGKEKKFIRSKPLLISSDIYLYR